MKPYHGSIRNLTTNEIETVLKNGHFGHLGVCSSGEVYVVPTSYAFKNGFLFSHTKPGKKVHMMRENPRICFQVEDVKNFYQWNSVIVWGTFEELKDQDALGAMRYLLESFREKEDSPRRSELEVEFSALLESAIIFRVRIERTTGRSEGP